MSAALLTKLIEAGTPAELVAEVALELGRAMAASEALERKKAQDRERQNRRRSRDITGNHGKPRDKRDPPKDNNIKPPSSEANASGGEPPADPIKQVFDLGVSVLTGTGTPEKQARSLIGKWCKGGNEAAVLQALLTARAKANPIEWLNARFKAAKWVSPSGYEYRGTDEQVLREAEKRNDMTTYWAIKGASHRASAQSSAGG